MQDRGLQDSTKLRDRLKQKKVRTIQLQLA